MNNGFKTFTAAAALAKGRFVKLSSGGDTVNYATLGDGPEIIIGITEYDCASGDPVTVRLFGPGKTFVMEAAGLQVTAGNLSGISTYNGKLWCGITSGVAPYMTSFETVSAAGGYVEAMCKSTPITRAVTY